MSRARNTLSHGHNTFLRLKSKVWTLQFVIKLILLIFRDLVLCILHFLSNVCVFEIVQWRGCKKQRPACQGECVCEETWEVVVIPSSKSGLDRNQES